MPGRNDAPPVMIGRVLPSGVAAREGFATHAAYAWILQADSGHLGGAVGTPVVLALDSDDLTPWLQGAIRTARTVNAKILIDLSHPATTTAALDVVLRELTTTLIDQHILQDIAPHMLLVYLLIRNRNSIATSAVVNERLSQHWSNASASVILISPDPSSIEPADYIGSEPSIDLAVIADDFRRFLRRAAAEALVELSPDEIRSRVDLLFGHFSIDDGTGLEYHTAAVASFRRAAQDQDVIGVVRRDAERMLATPTYYILPLGLDQTFMEAFSLAVADDDLNRVLQVRGTLPRSGAVVVLVDILSPRYQVMSTIDELKAAGLHPIVVISIYMTEGFDLPSNIAKKAYIELPIADKVSDQCLACARGSLAIPSSYTGYIGDIVRHKDFASMQNDPYLFWEMVRMIPGGADIKHWESTSTLYHYQGRIWGPTAVQYMGLTIATRIANEIRNRGILLPWIKNIVCVSEDRIEDRGAAEYLSEALSEIIPLNKDAIIRVRRSEFGDIAALGMPPSLLEEYAGAYGKDLEALAGRNVILVDQAAHRFETLGSLRNVSNLLRMNVLAYAVFLDRIGEALELEGYFRDAHYVSVYRWPCPPFLAGKCICAVAPR